jgi:hypothetical protein
MRRASWSLIYGRPIVEVVLTFVQGGQKVTRNLLADTGAGNALAPFEMLLDENDCLVCGATASHSVSLGGAYTGSYPLYDIPVEIPLLGFFADVLTVGVPTVPPGLDGFACFRFLNRFTYSNFGNRLEFGLET